MGIKACNLIRNQKFIFFLFVLAGGIISSLLRYELIWDFVNYHYYNAWAFVNNRFNEDPLMAGINGFFNPLPELPLYYMIKYFNDFPTVISFLQGIWFGILMYLTYRLILCYFDTSNADGKVKAFVCFLIAMTGNATFFQIGISSGEIMLAVFYLWAFYLLINEIFEYQSGDKKIFMATGFILGAAMGVKLTGVIYCVAGGATLILCHKNIKNAWQNIAWFTLFGVLGFLLFSGFWMWRLWQEFQNPFFPFANLYFKSDWLAHNNFTDQSFVPHSWKEFLLWPFFLCLTLHRAEGNDMFVADFRLMFVYIIFIYMLLKVVYFLVRRKKIVFNEKWLFLSLFLLLSYVVWAYFFSISRYFVIGEILMSLIIVKAWFSLKPKSVLGKGLYGSFLLLVLFSLAATPYFSNTWGRHLDWKKMQLEQDAYIGIEKLNIPDNALIQTYNYPTSAFFAFWADKNPTIKGVNVFQQINGAFLPDGSIIKDYYKLNSLWQKRRDDMVNNHVGPKFLLVAHGLENGVMRVNFSQMEEAKGMRCHFLRNNLLPFMSLCAPKEIADEVFVNNKMKLYEDADEK